MNTNPVVNLLLATVFVLTMVCPISFLVSLVVGAVCVAYTLSVYEVLV